MSENVKYVLSLVAIVSVVMLAAALVWVFKSYNEANSYRKLTGKEVTTWDAMFLDLRVQEQIQTRSEE